MDNMNIRLEDNKNISAHQNKSLNLEVFFKVKYKGDGPLIFQIYNIAEKLLFPFTGILKTKKVGDYNIDYDKSIYSNEDSTVNYVGKCGLICKKICMLFLLAPIWITALVIKALTYLNLDIRIRHFEAKKALARKNLIVGSKENPIENMEKVEKVIQDYIGEKKLKLNAFIIYLKNSSKTGGYYLNKYLKPKRIITIGGKIESEAPQKESSYDYNTSNIGYRKELGKNSWNKKTKFLLDETGQHAKVIPLNTFQNALRYNLPFKGIFEHGLFKRARAIFHVPYDFNKGSNYY